MTQFAIEKGVPIPTQGKGAGVGLMGALASMEPLDSLLVTGRKVTDVAQYLQRARRGTDKEFTSRTVEGGVRVWRLK